MKPDSLSKFIGEIRQIWGPLDSARVAKAQFLMEELAKTTNEGWIERVEGTGKSVELYRDSVHGFVLLAHTETKGLYRAPHDHGKGWVIYAVQSGEIEMRTYGRIEDKLVRRDTSRIRKGQARAYLPGDIHDTKCISHSVVMLRLTSCDLKKRKAGRKDAPI